MTICMLLERTKYKTKCHHLNLANFCRTFISTTSNWWSCVHFVIAFVWNAFKDLIIACKWWPFKRQRVSTIHYWLCFHGGFFSPGIHSVLCSWIDCLSSVVGLTVTVIMCQLHSSCARRLSLLESIHMVCQHWSKNNLVLSLMAEESS